MSDAVLRLLTVRDQARQVRDEAQRAMQQAERQWNQTQSQGQMLQGYRSDTAAKWTRPQDRATDTVQMSTAHDFLDRLDAALQQHEFSLQQVLTLAQRRRTELLAAETRLAALNKLIERRQQHAAAQRDRREQIAIDQLAQRRLPSSSSTDSDPWPSADDAEPSDLADRKTPSATPQDTPPCPN